MPYAASSSDSAGRRAHVPAHRGLGQLAVDRQRAAGERRVADVAEQQVGVGDRRLLVALAVAGRTRHRARAARAHAQRTAGIERRDAAAAGADFRDVDHRNAQQVTVAAHQPAADRHRRADLVFGAAQDLAALDDRRLGRGAAHVERDHVRVAACARHPLRGDDARRRARLDDRHRPRRGRRRADQAAVRLHDQDRRAHVALGQRPAQPVEVARDQRRDIGVDDRGAGALELQHLRQHVRRQRYVDRGQPLAQPRADRAFVRRRCDRRAGSRRRPLRRRPPAARRSPCRRRPCRAASARRPAHPAARARRGAPRARPAARASSSRDRRPAECGCGAARARRESPRS